MRIIATSGQGEENRVAALRELGISAFLVKPYRSLDLLTTLHEALAPTRL